MQRGFYIDLSRCTGCHACEVACKQWNDLPPRVPGQTGPHYRRVVAIEGGRYPNPARSSVSLSCMHCAKPACMAVCPTGAITKRAEDGIVVVDQNKCIGCRYCTMACPFGAPQFGEDGTMQKCDYCLDRLAQGMEPACVAACPGGALHAGTMVELAKVAAQKVATKLVGATDPSVLVSK